MLVWKPGWLSSTVFVAAHLQCLISQVQTYETLTTLNLPHVIVPHVWCCNINHAYQVLATKLRYFIQVVLVGVNTCQKCLLFQSGSWVRLRILSYVSCYPVLVCYCGMCLFSAGMTFRHGFCDLQTLEDCQTVMSGLRGMKSEAAGFENQWLTINWARPRGP